MTAHTRFCPQCLRAIAPRRAPLSLKRYASAAAAAIAPAPSIEQMTALNTPIARYPSTQPPSLKPPEFRRSQLLRTYASMLQSTPMMIFFQHSNLKATEWMAVRRELLHALRKVDEARKARGQGTSDLADGIRIQIIQTGVFGAALRIVEFYEPASQDAQTNPIDPTTQASSKYPMPGSVPREPTLNHVLSKAAHDAVANRKNEHGLEPLLIGPLAALSFPDISTEHLKAALSILSPQAPTFTAPRRRTDPGYYEPSVQAGLKKLILLGARVEGKVFDLDGTRWVGGIEGGIDGLRSQLVSMLQSIGAGITNTLEGASRSLYFTMETRKSVLEEEGGKPSEESSEKQA